VQIDVLTLFPEWFDWFRSQRHVANAVAGGHELRTLNPREHTPLSGGQVDDTPFGGGAGMVLRVDVMDAALQGFYGVDPVELRRERRVLDLVHTLNAMRKSAGLELTDRIVVTLARDDEDLLAYRDRIAGEVLAREIAVGDALEITRA
jgi:tRNA (guanine37-N1)-methyltransferase